MENTNDSAVSAFSARQQMNTRHPCARRTRHDGHAGRKPVITHHFEVCVSTAEQAREENLQVLVDVLKGFAKPGACIAVNAVDGLFQRLQGLDKILVLPIKVFLALGFRLIFINGRQVDRLKSARSEEHTSELQSRGQLV